MSDTDHEQQRRRRLSLLLVPFLLQALGNLVGSAFAPALLIKSPLLLVAISPLIRHLVMASNSVPVAPFVAVAMTSMLIVDPFMYLLGREYGQEALGWFERHLGGGARALRSLERLFQKAGPIVLLVSPGPLVCALAGAERMRPAVFVLINLAGTAGTLFLVRRFGERAAAPIDWLREFIAANVFTLTMISATLVGLIWLNQRRRSGPPGK